MGLTKVQLCSDVELERNIKTDQCMDGDKYLWPGM